MLKKLISGITPISYMETWSDNGSFAYFLPLFPPCVDIVIPSVTSITIN